MKYAGLRDSRHCVASEALQVAAGWPSARLGSIEVRPVEPGLRAERRYA